MVVSELREILRDYREEELRQLIVELYKSMPKHLKEEKEIDTLIKEGKELLHKKKTEKPVKKPVDIHALKGEIEEFIDNAYQQNYFAPNRVIPKKERPKWRFKVKAYIKSLQTVSAEGENGRLAAELMEKLYIMLSYSCSFYLFNSENPFRSVGIEQEEFLEIVLKKRFSNGMDQEAVNAGVKLVMTEGMDQDTLRINLFYTLAEALKTPDSKKMAIAEADRLRKELVARRAAEPKKKTYGYSSSEYRYREKVNNLVELVMILQEDLCEYEEGIVYFKSNYQEENREIALYVLLKFLYSWDQKEYWVREYEKAVKAKIKPRENLRKIYEYIKENGKFPENFWF